jgi:hypothetical protein
VLFFISVKGERHMKFRVMVFLTLLLLATLVQLSHGQVLKLTVATDKEFYNLGDMVSITGNLTQSGSLVTDALVAVQINDPHQGIHAIRTLKTGTILTNDWSVEIVNILPLQSSYPSGSIALFNVTFRNNDLSPHPVLIILSFYYGNNIPFATKTWWNNTLEGNKNWTITQEIKIPNEAPGGQAFVYGNALSGLPQDDGWAYSPEKTITFGITQIEEGTFSTTIKIRSVDGMLGNYTVHVCTFYEFGLVANETTFMVTLTTDLTGDGAVDIQDIALVAFAYGSFPGHERWDPICDLDGTLFIDIVDVAMVAFDFGKSGIPPP